MRSVPLLTLLALAPGWTALAQGPAPASPKASPTAPPAVTGYVVTVEVDAVAPEIKTPDKVAPEGEALLTQLRQQTRLTSKLFLAQDLSRQEIVSDDFILPKGTLLLHKAGDKFYVVADPKAKTYLVMDAEGLLTALEGGAGIVNSEYTASVRHLEGRKTIAGFPCRQSVVTVGYVSSIPFENDRVLVRQNNEIEVWHTSGLTSSAVVDHFFFKFQRDKTGSVQRALANEIGFPLEVTFKVTQAGSGKKAGTIQPGSLHYLVTDLKEDKKLDSELFRIPPADYRKLAKNPYFAAGALSAAAKAAGELVEEKKQ